MILLLIFFGVWAAVTSFWSNYPALSFFRSLYFIFISAGAVLGGYLFRKIYQAPLVFLIPANIFVVSLSLFSLVTNIPSDSWTGGNEKGFMGFAGHQNTLAGLLLFTLPSAIIKIPSSKGNSRFAISILLFLNLLILILTYSRASWLSLAAGLVIFLMLTKKWKLLIYSSASALLIILLIYFSPALMEKTDRLMKKDFPAFYSTREWMWVPSYEAALKGGLTGLGYGISHPEVIVEGTGSHYENGRYIREKGNSFLALIEETGLTGFALFIFLLIYVVKLSLTNNKSERKIQNSKFYKNTSSKEYSILNTQYSILIAAYIALLLHSQFEAWMVGVGSVLLPLFFFYAGSLILQVSVKPEFLNQ